MNIGNSPRLIEEILGQRLMLAFKGKDSIPEQAREAIRNYRPAGVSLFRSFNIDQPAQVYELTHSLQRIAREEGLPPFLIAADQEGGQLMAIGEGATPLPGNLALGAAGSTWLAYRAGVVLGNELAAMGINVNFAPCCDVNINPANPVIGTRSFGENPTSVAELAAAMTRGIQSCGVAATAKHFPGHGDTASDSHHGIPVVTRDQARLWQVEFPPFQAAIQAGVKLIMTAHLALPAVSGRKDIPSTLSKAVLKGVLRTELGYDGVIVTDAMDMKAIQQGERLGQEAQRAISAGCDLLLLTTDPEDHQRVYDGLLHSFQNGLVDRAEVYASIQRIQALKEWLIRQPPPADIGVVGCREHQLVAAEIAQKSITLVRDHADILPLRPGGEQRLAVVIPEPRDLTPADTSSYIRPTLAQALRNDFPNVDEIFIPHNPQEQDIATALGQIRHHQVVILGTINAFNQPEQARLAQAVLDTGIPSIVIALRMPYDLKAFPQAPTYLCSYSLMEHSMQALVDVLCGRSQAPGRLPVSIPGMYPAGHRENR